MKTINVNELKIKLENNEVLLVDVREPDEYLIEYIEGAYFLRLAEVSHEKLTSKSRPIVFYCRLGNRSKTACEVVLRQDPNLDVMSLEGGITAWKGAGFAVKHD
jgi:rhodanese-related sulfurtransferase